MSAPRLLALALALSIGALAGRGARADGPAERYAVVIGNNLGAPDEAPLRYAEEDAAKIARILRELGGFSAERLTLLVGQTAPEIRRALIRTNDVIRTRSAGRGPALLLVFFSGHADGGGLHLRGTSLDHDELRQLVRGSAAAVRLLVVDACRSGALTRVKGGRDVPAFELSLAEPEIVTGEGAVFLTSSAANEDAQESDEIRGSFFTHALASALLGAGDLDGDGRVVLEEAYRYAYESTLRASSRTLAGPQHPTFQYDLRGQGQIVLTSLAPPGGARAFLALPAGKSYLVMRGDRAGAVVGEVGAADRRRRLSVAPGRYFVRGRGAGHLLEGTVAVAAGETRLVEDRGLERIEYARLVRKGGADAALAHGPQAGYLLRSPLGGSSICQGPFAGYAFELPHLSVSPRLAACRGRLEAAELRARADELALQVTIGRAFDLPGVTVTAGVVAGGSLLVQRFSAPLGEAPARRTIAGQLGAGIGIARDLPLGFYVALDAAATSYLFRQEDGRGRRALATPLVVRGGAALGKRI